jgi:hypothetical protein
MTEPAAPPDAGVRNYTFLCLLALLVVLLALMAALPRAGPLWLLLPVLVGLGGLWLRWSAAPLLFLVLLGLIVYLYGALRTPAQARWAGGSAPATDLLLGVAALAYVAGHYRLQSLVRFVFPADPRRRAPRRRASPAGPQRPPARVPRQRSAGLASPGELVWLLLALPAYGLLALVANRWLVPARTLNLVGDLSQQGFAERDYYALMSLQTLVAALYRGRLLLWVLGGGVLVVSGLLGYVAWSRASRAEAEVFLQDEVWRETRSEQRTVNGWLVWATWRRGRGREGS